MYVLFVVSIGKSKFYVGPDLQRAIDKARALETNREHCMSRPVRAKLPPVRVWHAVV